MTNIVIEIHKNAINIDMPGTQGIRGVGIVGVELIAGDHTPGTSDTYRFTFTDGTTSDFQVYNGSEVDLSTTVQTTGNQSVAGVKTFTDIPVVPVGGIKISDKAVILFNTSTNSIDFSIN